MPHTDVQHRYEKLRMYPHMGPADAEIWKTFIEQNPNRFQRVWYDYHVGDPEEMIHACPDCIKQDWHDLTRWKIDVLAEDDQYTYVIEVKPHANAKALGQAKAYAALFIREHGGTRPVIAMVITDVAITSTQKAALDMGVILWTIQYGIL